MPAEIARAAPAPGYARDTAPHIRSPAWQASRVNPNETLKEGGRTGTSVNKHRLRRILVVAEFALALTLLAAAGLAATF